MVSYFPKSEPDNSPPVGGLALVLAESGYHVHPLKPNGNDAEAALLEPICRAPSRPRTETDGRGRVQRPLDLPTLLPTTEVNHVSADMITSLVIC